MWEGGGEKKKHIKQNRKCHTFASLIDTGSLAKATYRPPEVVGKKQPFVSARMDFTIHWPLLIKESPALLKVNDSAAIAASHVLQMMRLLIGL